MFSLKKMLVLMVFSVAMMAVAIAGPDNVTNDEPSLMPAHPDLLEKVGPAKVAELHARFSSREMARDMRIQRDKSGADKVIGTGTCLVILFEFVDHPADQAGHPASAYNDLIFSSGVYPTGSMNDYYQEVSYGSFQVDGYNTEWLLADNTYASYANGDGTQDAGTARVMLEDAIGQLDPILDFSLYDNDGPDGFPNSGDDDGYVDALFFIHSGPGQEQTGDTNDIWSHAWSFWDGLATNDGVSIRKYSVEPEEQDTGELVTLGVFAHEYGHVLGLPDLYDTDYSTNGIGEWGLMSGGGWTHRDGDLPGSCPAHMSAWSKKELGWIDPVVVTSDMSGVVISPSETHPVAYRIFRQGESYGEEYFLVENRRRIGFDEGLVRRQYAFDLNAPEGLAIYHVDESQSGNSNEFHRLVDVIDATPWFNQDGSWLENLDGPRNYDTWQSLSTYNRGDDGDLWPGFTSVTADSTDWTGVRGRNIFSDVSVPRAWDFECNNTGVVIRDITLSGADVTATFLIEAVAKNEAVASRINRVWDFETSTEGWKFCNSYAHLDLLHGDTCTGTGGLWFGIDNEDWFCPGYGNNWSDFSWVTVAVNTSESPQVILRHKYELENNYDYAYVEARPAGDLAAGWTQMAEFNGNSGCQTESFNIPQSVLNAANDGGVATVDIRLRLESDGGWSAEDGDFCGIGWWIDEISVTNMPDPSSGVEDLPGLGDVAHLNAPSPNPFNPATVLRFHVPAHAKQVTLQVFDQRGRLVRQLETTLEAGWQEVRWDGRDSAGGRAASGLYFARLNVDGVGQVQKMALVK